MQNFLDILEILCKVDPLLPLFGGKVHFDHVRQKRFQIIIISVQVVENARRVQVL